MRAITTTAAISAVFLITAGAAWSVAQTRVRDVNAFVTNFPLDAEGNLRVGGVGAGERFSLVQLADDFVVDGTEHKVIGSFDVSGWSRWTVVSVASTPAPGPGFTLCDALVVDVGVSGSLAQGPNEDFASCYDVVGISDPSSVQANTVRSAPVLLPQLRVRIKGATTHPVDVWLYLQR